MEKEKLLHILDFNEKNASEIRNICQEFYQLIGRDKPGVISDVEALAKFVLNGKQYQFVHIPMKSKEIGAFHLFINGAKYIVINTSKSRANNNFALVHELYHALINSSSMAADVEVYLSHYSDDENEMMANAFAGAILMPKEDFLTTASLLFKKADELEIQGKLKHLRELTSIYSLMQYYHTTYMSVVIRCYEFGFLKKSDDELMQFLLKNNDETIQREVCKRVSFKIGDSSVMEASYADDFSILYENAKTLGEKYCKMNYMDEEDLYFRLEGLQNAYLSVREVCKDGVR